VLILRHGIRAGFYKVAVGLPEYERMNQLFLVRLSPSFSLGAQPEAAFPPEAEGKRAEEQSAAASSRQPHHHGQETLTRHGR